MLATATEDGSRDGIALRYPPRRYVLLHRASETVGQPFECCEDRLGSDLSPSATPTAQASLTHCSKLAHRYGDSLLMRGKADDELDLSIREWCL